MVMSGGTSEIDINRSGRGRGVGEREQGHVLEDQTKTLVDRV